MSSEVLLLHLEGRNGDETAGIAVTAGLDTPPDARDAFVEGGKRYLRETYPGITDVQVVRDWFRYTLPDLEDGG